MDIQITLAAVSQVLVNQTMCVLEVYYYRTLTRIDAKGPFTSHVDLFAYHDSNIRTINYVIDWLSVSQGCCLTSFRYRCVSGCHAVSRTLLGHHLKIHRWRDVKISRFLSSYDQKTVRNVCGFLHLRFLTSKSCIIIIIIIIFAANNLHLEIHRCVLLSSRNM